jgi:hypothetical protein
MTAEESLRMAREAGLLGLDAEGRLERFRKLAYGAGVRAEREACARIAETTICDTHLPTGVQIYGSKAAAAIRARSNA